MRADLLVHLKWGAAGAIGLLAALLIGIFWHPSLALVFGGALVAWGLERYQAVRREGTPDHLDMAATFAPFGALSLIVWALY